jgi:hypothetical protein
MVSMKDEELAQDAVLSKVYEHEKDPETRLRVACQDGSSNAKRAAGGVSNKPYRYIEGYHLKGPKVCKSENKIVPVCLRSVRGVIDS